MMITIFFLFLREFVFIFLSSLYFGMFFFKNSNIRELEKKCTKDEWAVVIVRNINSLLLQYLSIDFKMKQKKKKKLPHEDCKIFFSEKCCCWNSLSQFNSFACTFIIYYILINFTVTLPPPNVSWWLLIFFSLSFSIHSHHHYNNLSVQFVCRSIENERKKNQI